MLLRGLVASIAAFAPPVLAQTTEIASVSTTGVPGNSQSYTPATSADSRYVAFTSFAHTLVSGDTNGASDIFVQDRVGGAMKRVSIATGGTQGNGGSVAPSISGNGRWIAFASAGSNLVANDTNAVGDLFLHDRAPKTYPSGHWMIPKLRGSYGTCLHLLGRWEEAEPELLRAHAEMRAVFPDTDPRVWAIAEGLHDLYVAWGRPEEAERRTVYW